MSYEERKGLLSQLEKKRKSKIITLIISDRNSTMQIGGINAVIAPDQADQIVKHIKEFEKKKVPY